MNCATDLNNRTSPIDPISLVLKLQLSQQNQTNRRILLECADADWSRYGAALPSRTHLDSTLIATIPVGLGHDGLLEWTLQTRDWRCHKRCHARCRCRAAATGSLYQSSPCAFSFCLRSILREIDFSIFSTRTGLRCRWRRCTVAGPKTNTCIAELASAKLSRTLRTWRPTYCLPVIVCVLSVQGNSRSSIFTQIEPLNVTQGHRNLFRWKSHIQLLM